MNANTAVAVRGDARLGAMVRSATSMFVYWRGIPVNAVRVRDLTGRTPGELLDGFGVRVVPAVLGQYACYVHGLIPGHLYSVDAGEWDGERFAPHLETTPVQTPWTASPDDSAFPSPYHRS